MAEHEDARDTLVVEDGDKTYAIPRSVVEQYEVEGEEVTGFAGSRYAPAAPMAVFWSMPEYGES